MKRTPIELLEVRDNGNYVRFRTIVRLTARTPTIRLLSPLNFKDGDKVEVIIRRL